MKFFKQVKKIFSPADLVSAFDLKRKYSVKDKDVTWAVKFLARKEITITRIDYLIEETILKPKKPGEKERDKEVTTIAKKKVPGPWNLEEFKEKSISFTLEIDPTEKRDKEKKSYSGDMALMDRIHDQSKDTVFTYKIIAKIKIKWQKEPRVIKHRIDIE